MGFVVSPTPGVLFSTGSSSAVTLPSGLRPGDRVLLWCSGTGGVPAPFGTPSGYTLIGAQSLVMAGGRYSALFYHDWSQGDPTTFTLTGGMTTNGWIALILRGVATPTVGQDNSTDPGTATSVSLASFGGGSGGYLRLALLLSVAAGSFTPPAPAVAVDNLSAQGFRQMIALSSTFQMEAWFSVNPDDSGYDANTSSWAHSSSVLYGRGLTFSDGGSRNGGDIGFELPEFRLDAAISARDLDEGEFGLSAAAGVFGGGAEIV